jgi:uncharacterized protein (TIGR04255 family)
MIDDSGNELVQIQSDRFVRNWRRNGDMEKEYPHFADHIRPAFLADYKEFEKFVIDEGLGDLNVDQCEVTYINHIPPNDVWSTHDQLDRVFLGWSDQYKIASGDPAETIALRTRHALLGPGGEFIGRFLVDLDAGYLQPADPVAMQPIPVFSLQLVARGRPSKPGLDGILEFMDMGHGQIVSSFATLTTPQMHKAWGRSLLV